MCVEGAHTDRPTLPFAVINNVVTQLEKTTGSRKKLP